MSKPLIKAIDWCSRGRKVEEGWGLELVVVDKGGLQRGQGRVFSNEEDMNTALRLVEAVCRTVINEESLKEPRGGWGKP